MPFMMRTSPSSTSAQNLTSKGKETQHKLNK
jgi:hypothetical protein